MSGTKEIQKLQDEGWKLYPHLFAKRASGGKWLPYKHLRYIASILGPALHKGGGRFIITAPPRHGKSETISNWLPTWYLYNHPQKKIILASYAAEFAAKWGAKVRENLTDNPMIQTEMSKSSKSKKHFMLLGGGQMMTAGMGGPITGSGADLLIIDDPLKNWQDAQSELIRARHKDWFRSVAMTRLEPNASVVILQTRWNEDDLSGWLLSGKNSDDDNTIKAPWTLINFPAICEDENDVLGRKIGEALCPERYDIDALNAIKKDLGEMVWSALYQQRPTSLQGNIILKDWLRFYDKLPDGLDEEAIFADLTFKDGTTTDFTVIECWGRKGSNIYLMDQIRARMGFPDQMKAIETMSKRHPNAYLKQIEDAANSAAVISMLQNEIMGLTAVKPNTSKQARLAAVSPIYQAGNVHYPNPRFNSWVDVNIAEILTFPNAKHDDTVDVASMSVGYFSKYNSSVQRLEALSKW